MKILCAYSSIEFSCDHFPAILQSREAYHPIFNIPQRKLLPYISKWAASELTPIDSYLLFLATLRSSDLVDFRVPAIRTDQTDSIIASNMESLMKTVIKLNTVTNQSTIFPRYVITPETRGLGNVQHWIQNWKDAYTDNQSGVLRDYDNKKLIAREHALERMIKSPHKSPSQIAPQLAEWASIAGSFPSFSLISPMTGLPSTCSDYWKELIIKCAREEMLFSIPKNDLDELIEHVETNISYGTIFSSALFKLLRHAKDKQKNYLGLGDLDLSTSVTKYQILNSTDSVEDANIRAMIDSAPTSLPRLEQYPSKFAFMKAKMRWDMSQKYMNSSSMARTSESVTNETLNESYNQTPG